MKYKLNGSESTPNDQWVTFIAGARLENAVIKNVYCNAVLRHKPKG